MSHFEKSTEQLKFKGHSDISESDNNYLEVYSALDGYKDAIHFVNPGEIRALYEILINNFKHLLMEK